MKQYDPNHDIGAEPFWNTGNTLSDRVWDQLMTVEEGVEAAFSGNSLIREALNE